MRDFPDAFGDDVRNTGEDEFILAHPFSQPCPCLAPQWWYVCRCNCHRESTCVERICWARYEHALVNADDNRLR